MKRFAVGFVALSGCILGAACGDSTTAIENPVDPGTDAGNDTGSPADALDASDASDASDGPEPSRACPANCLPPAPGGWTGPSATYDGVDATKPADCPAGYTEKKIEAHQGLTAGAASCECGAPTITGRGCSASVESFVASNCLGGLPTKLGTVTTKDCFTANDNTPASYRVATPTLVPGTCTYPSAKTTLPSPTFQKVNVACGLPQTVACEGRSDCIATPAPAEPYGRLCIHKAGDNACPSADYAVKILAFEKVDDTRGCSACSATPAGGACGSTWGNRLKVADCGGASPPTDKTAGSCYAYPGAGTIIDIAAMGPTAGTCTPTGGAPTGAASSIEPVTFCCNK